ncbi:MAG: DinB family protein [Dehalococcoidia bacterium]|nr:DinB family protein [Dehalococcoidia bacterium]
MGVEVSIHVAEEVVGTGPFTPGDACALFSIERSPVTPGQIEDCIRLMSYSRSDLLALVAGLPDELLDWRESETEFSLRILLRHIGNAEEWYISRLFEPDQLPQEWAEDHSLPIFEFLDLERCGCVDCLRRLDERQRSEVFHPAHFTDHPEEEWTARKVLRRFVEHEREHTGQAREILAACSAGKRR